MVAPETAGERVRQLLGRPIRRARPLGGQGRARTDSGEVLPGRPRRASANAARSASAGKSSRAPRAAAPRPRSRRPCSLRDGGRRSNAPPPRASPSARRPQSTDAAAGDWRHYCFVTNGDLDALAAERLSSRHARVELDPQQLRDAVTATHQVLPGLLARPGQMAGGLSLPHASSGRGHPSPRTSSLRPRPDPPSVAWGQPEPVSGQTNPRTATGGSGLQAPVATQPP